MRYPSLVSRFPLPLAFVALVACSGSSGGGSPGTASDASVDAPPNLPDASGPTPDAAPSPPPPPVPDAGVDANPPDLGDDGGDAGAPDSGDDGGVIEAGPVEAGPVEAGPTEAGVPEGGPVPSSCVDLSGEYIANTDHFMLTRGDCGSLKWVSVPGFVNPANWTHVYTTDGVARSVTDEQGNPIVEEAHVDDVAMYVHRTSSSGLDIHQKVYFSNTACNLIGATGTWLARETTGTQPNCENWQRQ